jgi:hypothetical protein
VPLKAYQILGDVANQYSNLEFWRNLQWKMLYFLCKAE